MATRVEARARRRFFMWSQDSAGGSDRVKKARAHLRKNCAQKRSLPGL